jgi:hypothetical protein
MARVSGGAVLVLEQRCGRPDKRPWPLVWPPASASLLQQRGGWGGPGQRGGQPHTLTKYQRIEWLHAVSVLGSRWPTQLLASVHGR